MNATTDLKQTKFYGEVSPLLYGDTTNPKYLTSLRTCKNWIPTPQGALAKRPGTKFIGFRAAGSTAPSHLIPFVFSDGQAFVLEFNMRVIIGVPHGTIHFYQNGQSVGPGYQLLTVFSDIRMLPYLKFAQIGDTITICYGGQVPGVPAVAPQDLVHTPGAQTPWTIAATPLAIPTAAMPQNPSVNILPYNPATVYNVGDQASQTHVLWTSIQDTNTGNAPPAPALNPAGTGLNGNLFWTPSVDPAHPAVTRAWVLTAVVQDPNGVTFETVPSAITSGTGPLSTDRRVPLAFAGAFSVALPAGWSAKLFKLYASNGAAQIFGWLQDILPPTGLIQVYDVGAAPDYTRQPPHGTDPFLINGADSFPSVVGYLDQRRLFSATALRPITTNLSKVGDFYNYDNLNSPGSDTDAFNFDLASEVLEQMRSWVPMRRGLAMTGQGEWAIAGLTGGPVSRSSIDAKRQSRWGSSWLQPAVIGTGVIFNTAKSNMVRDLYPLYGLYADIWDGQDLSVLVRHLLDYHTIVDWAFQTVPYPVLWIVRDDGVLLSMTYQHAPPSFGQTLTEGVVAWAQHPTAPDMVFSLCVVPEPPEDALYLQTLRGAGGFACIERAFSPVPAASPYLPGVADVRYAKYLDSSVQYDGHNDQLGLAGILARIDSDPHPGSVNPADFQVGSLVRIGVGSAAFTASDAANPYGSAFVFDPENTLGLGPIKAHIVGFVSNVLVLAELDTALTPAQITAWAFGAGGGGTVWAIAKGQLTATHLSTYAVDSGLANGARGVSALVDGDRQIPAAWAGGVAFFQTPGVVINLGLAYNSDGEQLDAFHPSAEIRAKFMNLLRVGFQVAGTRSMWVGKDFDNLAEWEERQVSDNFSVMGLHTGFFEQFVTGEFNKNGRSVFRHFEPLPAIITSVLREMKLGDS